MDKAIRNHADGKTEAAPVKTIAVSLADIGDITRWGRRGSPRPKRPLHSKGVVSTPSFLECLV